MVRVGSRLGWTATESHQALTPLVSCQVRLRRIGDLAEEDSGGCK